MSIALGSPHRREIPPLARDRRVVAGVAAGVAAALGVAPIVVRAAFVALAAAGGLGVLLYLALLALMARSHAPVPEPVEGLGHPRPVVAVCLIAVGGLLLASGIGIGFSPSVSGPLALVGVGLLFVWHRGRLGSLVGDGRATLRIVAGLLVAGAGIVGMVALNVDLSTAWNATLLSVAVVAGLALVAAPAVASLGRELAEERRRRVRSEERARVAAHLHDSVLQTLALVQRGSDDPSLRALARRQERELRSWLYGAEDDRRSGTVRAGLDTVCGEVEELHGVPVDVVSVGPELELDSRTGELLAAVQEAVTNAARHSGADHVDVYLEAGPDEVAVFVRDTGKGFDLAAVPPDRAGVRNSVVGRLARLGGSAVVESAPGSGTEVELRLPREAA